MTLKKDSSYYSIQYRTTEEVGYREAQGILRTNPNSILLDVRSNQEYREYHLPGAINLPLYDITPSNARSRITNKETTIIVYCATGHRSMEAFQKLKNIGYYNIYRIRNGLEGID